MLLATTLLHSVVLDVMNYFLSVGQHLSWLHLGTVLGNVHNHVLMNKVEAYIIPKHYWQWLLRAEFLAMSLSLNKASNGRFWFTIYVSSPYQKSLRGL